ncbi:hypothetical protein BCR32DRAFT_325341 [Anaeromyces robustus]|uniref:Uncharacterized protein n=1 Tax=Anaeromyces robustus TaxID=1754192 RepID=A0A1Y1XIY7_9FUNG|nr:hypothetical protein BCR32DRAFT_325341 [Anaeromyces robustus]|eukprot:ORX85662.1 hypothetical protein BCR32DRAFT_325341 [Anaeromyces robustus]
MKPNTKYLIPQVLIVDTNNQNWIENDNDEEGYVNFLNKELIDSIIKNGFYNNEIINKCKAVDHEYKYEEYKEIHNEKDIKDFYSSTTRFHDAFITKEVMQKDRILYLHFDGVWGCEVEIWFWDDIEYDTSSRNPKTHDPYWNGSTVIIKDDFIYFIDDIDMTIEKINKDYCYFKARHMKYHLIPD